MADVQKYFRQFDDAIRYERDDEKAILSEKRERVLRKLSAGIKRQREEGKEIPSYTPFNQGSYAMNTGIKPLDGDFDIDVGLRFDLKRDEYPDPVVVKTWVHDAVDGHTKKVRMRRSCITVYYQEEGEDIYHVDLAIYARAESDGKDYLARGKPSSPATERIWLESDAHGLVEVIAKKHSGQDAEQFRRTIRALKRWKDVRFDKHDRSAPRGITLTAAAYHWFSVSKQEDSFANTTRYDDADALRRLINTMLNNFTSVWSDEEQQFTPRLRITVPVSPYSDLCETMSDAKMREFKKRLEELLSALNRAQDDVDPHTGCKALAEHFGSDFPVPEKSETAEKRDRAITSSGNSA